MAHKEPAPSEICTTIEEYDNPETGSRVSLVGMIHVGDPEYYAEVQDYIDDRQDLDNAVVHYEAIGLPTPEKTIRASKVSRKIMKRLGHSALIDNMKDHLGLVDQRQALSYDDTWENHDADIIDVAERLPKRSMRLQTMASKLINFVMKFRSDEAKTRFYKRVLGSLDTASPKKAKSATARKSDEIILDMRNNIALDAVEDQLDIDPSTDIVLLWGQHHLKGLRRGLRELGYLPAEVEDIVAIDLDRIAA